MCRANDILDVRQPFLFLRLPVALPGHASKSRVAVAIALIGALFGE
jgi:ABC-type nitrate/sulfonate/bicarbonate transport system permease component